MIQFILMVNKQGQTRLSKYYNSFSVQERITTEGELIRKCLSRVENQVSPLWLTGLQCSFVEHRQYKVIYRRYASLYFIVGLDIDDDIVSPPLSNPVRTSCPSWSSSTTWWRPWTSTSKMFAN